MEIFNLVSSLEGIKEKKKFFGRIWEMQLGWRASNKSLAVFRQP
jgi:hypothetical protein